MTRVTLEAMDAPRRYHGAMPSEHRTLFEDAVDVPLWLETDRDKPLAARVDRDRAFGRSLPAADDLARVRAWWTALRPGSDAGRRVDGLRRLVALALAAVGALVGSTLAGAALYYDGSNPVNVVRAFAILIGVQTLSLALTLVTALPARRGLGGLQRLLVSVDPAAIAAAFVRPFAARLANRGDGVARLFAWHGGRSAANRFAKWQIIAWSQTAAVAFNVGVLATAFALVAFTDLAFGWSTTLTASPADVAAIAGKLALPWAQVLPDAVPSLELVERSRVFRLEGASNAPRAAESFTGWWPFLLCAIVAYGLVPRVLSAAFAHWRLTAATRALLLDDARVTALLDRMGAPSLHLAAETTETGASPDAGALARPDAIVGNAAAIVWADALPTTEAAAAAKRLLGAVLVDGARSAGGAARLDDDRRMAAEIATLAPAQVIVFTRAWEPPLLEFTDFLETLRAHLGRSPSIVVCPLPPPGAAPDPAHVETWRRTLGAVRDDRLYVEAST